MIRTMHRGKAAVSVDTIMQESEKFQAHYAREKGGKPLPWHHAEPNRFLDPITEARDKPGTALDLGCGSGVSVFKQMGQMFGLAKGVFCSSFSYYAGRR